MTTVLIYRIVSGYGIYGGIDFASGLYIHVKIDNPTGGAITVEIRDDEVDGNLIGTASTGPNLFTDSLGDVERISPEYGWCDDGDYIYYASIDAFPYTVTGVQFDSNQCTVGGGNGGILCDTVIDKIDTVNSTDDTSADGKIIITASSVNKPSSSSFFYGYVIYDSNGNGLYQEDNSTGTFENVAAGEYFVWVAWGAGNCRQTVRVVVRPGPLYPVRYRLEYDDIRQGTTRIDVLKKNYDGSIEEICGTGDPFTINYEGDENDAYKAIVPCGCELNVLSTYPKQFYELFEDGDDQMFQICAYHKIPAQPFVPAVMDPIEDWDTTISPTIGPIGNFTNDGFGNSYQKWYFYALPSVTINNLNPSKYLVTPFVAAAGQAYNFSLDYVLSTLGPSDFRQFNFTVSVVLFDATNSIVGIGSVTRDYTLAGTHFDFTEDFTITPSANVVQVGIQFKNLKIDFRAFEVSDLDINNVRVNWTTLSPPTVTLTGNQAVNKLYKDYFFEAGEEYSFDYDFSNGGTWLIEFTDSAGNDFGVNKTVVGAASGNHTFTAPSGISRIVISVSQTSGTRTCIINSFENVTQSQNVGGSTFELFGKWFVLTQFYSEEYDHEPNAVKILGTDGLGDLKNINFVDSFGNKFIGKKSYMQVISEILKHTPLELPIRSTVNLYDSGMDQNITDDPLNQLYFDPVIYKEKDAEFALNDMLTVLGARIFQALGTWWVLRVEYSVSSNLTYRQFDFNGVYQSYGSIDTVIPLTGPQISERLNFRDRSQVLALNSNFGSFSMVHNLTKDGNLIDGTFETEQIDESTSSGFLEWDFIQGQAAMSWGYEAVDEGDSKGAFFAQFNPGTDHQNYSRLYTKKIPLKIASGDVIKINFDLMVIPQFQDIAYQLVSWQFRITDNVTGNTYDFKPTDNNQITYVLNTEVINEMYINDFNSFKNIELGPFSFAGPSFIDASFQLSFYFHNHYGRDYDFQATELRFAPTASVPIGSQEYYVMDYSNTLLGVITRAYRLTVTTEDDDGVNVIRPNDYHEFNNPRQWQKIGDYAVGRSSSLTKKILFDNVVVAYYPQRIDPPGTVTYGKMVNPVNKNKFEAELFLGDLPNYFNAGRIYNGWLRLQDDTPTNVWHRREVIENKLLLKILLDEYVIQRTRTKKLSGRVIANSYISYLNSFQDYIDNHRYTNTRFSIDDKNCSYQINGVRVDVGDNGEPPVDLSAFTIGFSLGFES